MGIDLHNLRFLAHAQDLGVSFERTLAIGRQAVFVDPPDLARVAALRRWPALRWPARPAGAPAYFEPLLQQAFGARVTDSVDASPYEQATLVHDMNQPWVDAPAERYSAVLDYGCLEHVFDFATAWRNVSERVAIGGHLLHALPANNLCGHGFYQFSPELFCNLYQPARGWALRALFAVMKDAPRHWWRVANPLVVQRRVNLANAHEVYLLVLAQRLADPGPLPPPQQSDYAQSEWLRDGGTAGAAAAPSRWQAPLAALGLLDSARALRATLHGLRRGAPALPPPDFERVDVEALLARGAAR